MSKTTKTPAVQDENEAFEIIEMAIDDIEILTRAFNVISEVCEEINHPRMGMDCHTSKPVLN